MANHVGIYILVITCAFVASQQTSTLTNIYSTMDDYDLVPSTGPSKPRNISVLEVNSNEIRLSWMIPRRENEDIDGYFIYYRASNYTDAGVRTIKMPPNRVQYIEYTLKGLKPNTEYIIFVKAFTPTNEGELTDLISSKTDISGPSAPRHLNVTCQAGNKISVQWERPQHFFSSIDYYYIYIYLDENISCGNYTIPTSEDYLEVTYVVANLTTRKYKVQVTGASYSILTGRLLEGQVSEAREVDVNSKCDTEQEFYENYSTTVEYNQDDLIPSKPRYLTVLEVNSNEIRLSWMIPQRENRDIDGYFVYFITSNYTDVRTIKIPPNRVYYIEYTLEGLKPNTEYIIFVKAFTPRNEGEPTDLIRSKTASGGPSAPRHLNVVCQAQNTIFVQWERPDHFFNSIDYYYINISYLNGNTTYQKYTIPTSKEYLKVSFTIANVTSNAHYKVQVYGASYSQSSSRALLQGQVTEAKEVYVQLDCDKLQQYNMRHATVCSELFY